MSLPSRVASHCPLRSNLRTQLHFAPPTSGVAYNERESTASGGTGCEGVDNGPEFSDWAQQARLGLGSGWAPQPAPHQTEIYCVGNANNHSLLIMPRPGVVYYCILLNTRNKRHSFSGDERKCNFANLTEVRNQAGCGKEYKGLKKPNGGSPSSQVDIR